MEKKYNRIVLSCGKTLKDCVLELVKYANDGEFVCIDFNGHTLYSDTVSMDSAYKSVLGESYFEFLESQRKWKEDYDNQKKRTS